MYAIGITQMYTIDSCYVVSPANSTKNCKSSDRERERRGGGRESASIRSRETWKGKEHADKNEVEEM